MSGIDGLNSPSQPQPAPAQLARGWKLLISAALIFHLAAVVISPLSLEGSPIAGRLGPLFRPYVEAAYLDHGYHFFAPEPGPSHLLRYEVELANGKTLSGSIPNRDENRPRLFYHRHFMLTEFLNMLHAQAEGINDPAAPQRQLFESYSRSYANHLLEKYDGRRVTLRLVRHLIPYPDQVLAGRRLNDPALYQQLYHRTYVAAAQ